MTGRRAFAKGREKDSLSCRLAGGEGGIRTPDRGVSPYNGLANRRLQPLGHLSGVFAASGIVPAYGHLQQLAPTSLPVPSLQGEVLRWIYLGLPNQGWAAAKTPK